MNHLRRAETARNVVTIYCAIALLPLGVQARIREQSAATAKDRLSSLCV